MNDPDTVVAVLIAGDLRCEYLVNPLGIDVRAPRLSWKLAGGLPGDLQSAYRITAASTEAASIEDHPDLWDSGMVSSSHNVHIPYGGVPPGSEDRVYWSVRIWDRQGRPGGVPEPAWFEMGLLDSMDWRSATWIAGCAPSPLLRKSFPVSRIPMARARLYICGQGVYDAAINGVPVGNQPLGPQLSYYPERMLYDTFDVTGLLRAGENVLAVQLVPGWFGGDRRERDEWLMRKPDIGHALIAHLAIRYADGAEERIGTDGSWKTSPSGFEPVATHWVHCFQGSGECRDAEHEPHGWDRPGFDDTDWASAVEIPAPTHRLRASMIEPNRVVEILSPVSIAESRGPLDRDGFAAMAETTGARNWSLETMRNPTFARHWQPRFSRMFEGHRSLPVHGKEIDFGKHVSGFLRLDATGDPGDTVTLFGLDQHRLAGRGVEVVGQRFMHRAFRYATIHYSGRGRGPDIENIRALAVQNDTLPAGRFACSNDAVNRIHDVAARTWNALLLSGMPTDSWRERFGSALIQNFESSFYWAGSGAFYTKWMTDYRDIQRPDGYPIMSGGPIAYDYWTPNSGKNAIVFIPWLLYLHYGDRDALETNYPAMRSWLRLCEPKREAGRTWQPPDDHGDAEAGYGDHGRPNARWYEPHTGDLFETLHTIHCLRVAGRIATVLGHMGDMRYFAAVRERLVAKVNCADFLDRASGVYGGGDQGCQALAVHEDVAPPELRDAAVRELIRNVAETHDGHLDTGFVGTWYLLKTLIMHGRPDLAMRVIANPTPPSFACMLRHPDSPEELTFLPEFHGTGMIPHPGWCSVGFWFYQSLGGIRPDPEHPGFERVIIRPQIPPQLQWVEAEHDSIRGCIGVRWTRETGQLALVVTVPPNVTAQIHVPRDAGTEVIAPASGCAPLSDADPGHARFETGAGTYRFTARLQFTRPAINPGLNGGVMRLSPSPSGACPS